METILILAAALFLDFIISDPKWLPHPVVMMAVMINFLEKKLWRKNQSPLRRKLLGGILVVVVLISSYFISYFLVETSQQLNKYFAYFIKILLLSLCLALKGLIKAGKEVYNALQADNLELAREKVNLIVGRDCSNSDQQQVIRAALETLAENTSDGIVAPIFYYLLGGLPLAVVYKAVNTMDSMLGYKNEKYLNFGFAAAKTDDLVNYLPARITAIFMLAASLLLNYNFKNAFKTIRQDASGHPSPNAGYPEAAAAGALSLRFGGFNFYQGQKSFRNYIGTENKKFEIEDIIKINKLIYLSVFLFLISTVFIIYLI